MPTLIRLLVVLLVLAGLAFGGMVALTIMVDPGVKEMRVRIPAKELGVESDASDPLGLRPREPAAPVVKPAEGEPTTVDIPE